MKTMMRGGNKFRKGVSLLLMMCLLIALLPTAATAATTVGAYGSCTVTTKNVVIRTSPAGPRTGYFAQKGTYPMIGPVETLDGVDWYNIQTSDTAGYVSGLYATASYGSAGMPSTSKVYVDILADTVLTLGADPLVAGTPVTVPKGSVLQVAKSAYSVSIGGSSVSYINLYYYNGTTFDEYYTPYTNSIANGVMTTDNLNNYIYSVVWANYAGYSPDSYKRQIGAKGDLMTHAIQAALKVLDYYDDAVDGSFGALTTNAL